MNENIDLVWLGPPDRSPAWTLGKVRPTEATPDAIYARVQEGLPASNADAWLFWDSALGAPDPDCVRHAFARPGDVWHAGTRLAPRGWPGLMDAIASIWMLNADPDASLEATSWRISLRACLVRTMVLRQMGTVRPQFRSLDAAALELGHRYVTRGVLTRQVPGLVPKKAASTTVNIPFADELRFVYYRFSKTWSRWAVLRGVLRGYVSPAGALAACREVYQEVRPADPSPYQHADAPTRKSTPVARVTALIPTVDRYPYLRTLLEQLRHQTVPPAEIIVVDQTARDRRQPGLFAEFGDLPLRVIYQNEPGQCTSRNAGLQLARGDYILFLDDDNEVEPTLIEAHLQNLERFRAEVSCGVSNEAGAGPRPAYFSYIRASDVFPTNNTLIRKDALRRSGLFDLAYDRGQRADGDLGMRVYLAGALMVLNPGITVFHHHAPSGGLRTHKARVVTYASSRSRLTHRHLPSTTEVYLAQRYFTQAQLREMLWQSVLGTFSIRGSYVKRAAKMLVSGFLLPLTFWELRARTAQARQMATQFPEIAVLS